MLMLDKVRRMASQFDILHFHTDQFHFPIFHGLGVPDRYDAARPPGSARPEAALSPVSRHAAGFDLGRPARARCRMPTSSATVPHGLPRSRSPTREPRGGYLAFLGRISPEKRVDRAIAIARAVGLPLKIAAKVDRVDEAYFRSRDRAAARQPGIEYIGEIDERRKPTFLGEARALLFPIDWPEPFGLVMIEAMACGTPVLAFRRGSVPEVIDDGVTGWVVDSMDEAMCKLGQVLALDRARCDAASRSGSRSPAWRGST